MRSGEGVGRVGHRRTAVRPRRDRPRAGLRLAGPARDPPRGRRRAVGGGLGRRRGAGSTGSPPADLALRLAELKCAAVAADIHDGSLVLGCDSVLELDGEALGKPDDAADAVRRWQRDARTLRCPAHRPLPARHQVGRGASRRRRRRSCTSRTSPTPRSRRTSHSGEPLHVAGAFTVDGLGGAFVTGIEGDHHNVVGLSLPAAARPGRPSSATRGPTSGPGGARRSARPGQARSSAGSSCRCAGATMVCGWVSSTTVTGLRKT